MRYIISTLLMVILGFCFGFSKHQFRAAPEEQTKSATTIKTTTSKTEQPAVNEAVTKSAEPAPVQYSSVKREDYVSFAQTLLGTPYVYGSVDPTRGFDCSGFINYVSRHFGLKVPRSSVEFTNFGETVDASQAKPGDLILFTGTDASRRVVGHMGIVTENNNGDIQFIHSSSGKGKGVVISEVEGYYETRFVKVIRILNEEANS